MEQLKVLIVDDEHLIRNLLRMRINWEQQGLIIIGEASNAQEALEFIDKQQPDIIFTDIYMPNIDGIELSRKVLEKYPNIKIVVVTGHDEFEYAQQSIKLGIFDFLLKPIRAADLLHVADKLKGKIAEERAQNEEMEQLRAELRQNFPYLREKFLQQWLQGKLSREELRGKAAYFNVPQLLGHEAYQVAVIEVALVSEKHTEEQLILLGMEVKHSIEALLQGETRVILVPDAVQRFVMISFQSSAAEFVEFCESLIACLTQASACVASIGIGRTREDVHEAYLGYQEACRAIRYKAFTGNNQVICLKDIVESRRQPYRSDPELLQQLQFYVSVGSTEGALELLTRIFAVPFSGVAQFRLAAMDVITECQRAAMEQQIEEEQGLPKEMLVSMFTVDNLPELVQALKRYVSNISEAICAKNQAREGNLIGQVRAYLEEHMGDSQVGLASTAAAFFVSPGHLGRLMKKETGQTFVEYLTYIRMKKAEMLLKTTDLKGYEIGELVGIPDPHYFSILFKKVNGRPMNEYRNSGNGSHSGNSGN